MKKRPDISAAARAAFPYTVPILAGFLFLGIAYGIYMNVSGFSPIYPFLMSLTIFAGSVEFVTVNLLLGAFNPLGALLLALMVNARHLFYGLSMLDRYRNTGKKRWYLIFGMCDESFSINCTAEVPDGIDGDGFIFRYTFQPCLLGCRRNPGGLFGSLLSFNTSGLEFVMTALMVVLFLEQLLKEKNILSALLGLGLPLICLLLFGRENYLIPSMLAILGILALLRAPLEKAGDAA